MNREEVFFSVFVDDAKMAGKKKKPEAHVEQTDGFLALKNVLLLLIRCTWDTHNETAKLTEGSWRQVEK